MVAVLRFHSVREKATRVTLLRTSKAPLRKTTSYREESFRATSKAHILVVAFSSLKEHGSKKPGISCDILPFLFKLDVRKIKHPLLLHTPSVGSFSVPS
jgi:hypothetical protein